MITRNYKKALETFITAYFGFVPSDDALKKINNILFYHKFCYTPCWMEDYDPVDFMNRIKESYYKDATPQLVFVRIMTSTHTPIPDYYILHWANRSNGKMLWKRLPLATYLVANQS